VGALKLDVHVLYEDAKGEIGYGPVIIQTTEAENHLFDDPVDTEQWLELGFHSKVFVTPISAFRVRIPNASEMDSADAALIHYTFYG
jgi:hypothetical protein